MIGWKYQIGRYRHIQEFSFETFRQLETDQRQPLPQTMPPISRLLLVSILPCGLSQAASTAVSLETAYSGAATFSINTSDSATRNLGDLTGLTPGQSIQVEFAQSDPVFWEGYFYYPAGELTLTWTATVEVNIDGNIFSFTDTWTLGPQTVEDGGPAGVYGFQFGPEAGSHAFVVPWGTDLSDITITLRDLTSIEGGYLTDSSMAISGTLTTSSVPEPSAALFSILLPAALLLRRRRK
jgi:hypothetical protein